MEHYLRPMEAMEQYIQPSLANELEYPTEDRRQQHGAKIRLEHNECANTIIKDDDLWKELQKELARSKCVSRAAIQETTRLFIEKRRDQLDEQARIQQLRERSRLAPRSRRGSSTLDYSRRSSLAFVAAKGEHIRRTLSMGHGSASEITQNEPCSKRETILSGFVSNQFSKMNESFSKLKVNDSLSKLRMESAVSLPVRDKFFPAASRSRASDDIFEVLENATAITDNLDHSLNSFGLLSINEEISHESSSEVLQDNSEGELLVLFPSEPRQRTQTQIRDPSARSA